MCPSGSYSMIFMFLTKAPVYLSTHSMIWTCIVIMTRYIMCIGFAWSWQPPRFIWYSRIFSILLVLFLADDMSSSGTLQSPRTLPHQTNRLFQHEETPLTQLFKYQWPIWLSWIKTNSSWARPASNKKISHLIIPYWELLYLRAAGPLTGFGILSWVQL